MFVKTGDWWVAGCTGWGIARTGGVNMFTASKSLASNRLGRAVTWGGKQHFQGGHMA